MVLLVLDVIFTECPSKAQRHLAKIMLMMSPLITISTLDSYLMP
ncbi:hypothetical protein M917_2090 [Psychrobacter aquaticus CMS 56]|uniref:Uncharacterized protein n=1 Tax=Psychrobacter aquaticus CMS 56 TaxID=1354303 RepID=U4T7N4_9GAMM|nr:hypothetical protein M917_2090 [Psychrobacter aquaticus CMS 56]